MGWADFYRRRDALDAVLEHARREPDGRLPFGEVSGVAEVFGSPVELLLALHYRWLLALTGRLGVALSDAAPDADPVDTVAAPAGPVRRTGRGGPEPGNARGHGRTVRS